MSHIWIALSQLSWERLGLSQSVSVCYFLSQSVSRRHFFLACTVSRFLHLYTTAGSFQVRAREVVLLVFLVAERGCCRGNHCAVSHIQPLYRYVCNNYVKVAAIDGDHHIMCEMIRLDIWHILYLLRDAQGLLVAPAYRTMDTKNPRFSRP